MARTIDGMKPKVKPLNANLSLESER